MKAPSPFDWSSSPSLLAAELKPLKSGKTRSQVAAQAVIDKEKRDGRNPGTIPGLSTRGHEQIRRYWGRSA